MNTKRPRLTKGLNNLVKGLKNKSNRVLVIGDIHAPFTLDGYLEHCVRVKEKYNCNKIVFIGDCIDSHYSSYHETDPDGLSGGEELDLAVKMISKWAKAFPKATVILGNHDRIIMRKAFTGGIPKAWIRDYKEVLNTPGWDFVESKTIDNVLYIHGEGGTARTRMKKELHSLVQGHLHTQMYIDWAVGANFKVFGMQVGCGIDKDSFAMAYAKNFGKPAIACGVILENGTLPILEPMRL